MSKEVLALKQALRQRRQELKVLQAISETINGTLDLEALLGQIVELVVDVTHADACLLYLLDERAGELVLRASKNPHPRLIGRITLGLGEGITGWVAKKKTPVMIARRASLDPRFRFFHNLQEDRYEAFLSMPVLRQGQVVGVINVQHRRPHRHGETERALLATIAHQVGGAIETARLFREMEHKARQLETLSKVSTTIVSNQYLQEILQLIVTVTAEMMGSTICSIVLLDEQRQELEIAATQSLSEEYRRKPSVKVGQSISGLVVKERRLITVLDVRTDPRYLFRDLAKREGLCSLLSVPMMVKDRIVGVINSYTSSAHHFPGEETELLQTVASQAAVAIENTRLIQQTAAMQEALETRKCVERAKGILMRKHKLSEDETFRLIQRQSMNTRKTMREIAEAIILASEIQKTD